MSNLVTTLFGRTLSSLPQRYFATVKEYPFMIHRSRFGQLPVYTRYRLKGQKQTTVIRKYEGNVAVRSVSIDKKKKKTLFIFFARH